MQTAEKTDENGGHSDFSENHLLLLGWKTFKEWSNIVGCLGFMAYQPLKVI